MGKKNNIIEINGQKYDARTGAVLGTPAHPKSAVSHKKAVRTIDGLSKPVTSPVVQPQVVSAAERQAKLDREQREKLRAARKAHKVAAHAAKAPEPAKTLMRTAVKKPQPSFKSKVKAQTPVEGAIAPSSRSLAHKVAAHAVHPRRNELATKIAKSQAISRFAPVAAPTPGLIVHPTTAVAAPLSEPYDYTAPLPTYSERTPSDLLQSAINNATSHEEAAPKIAHKHHRARRVAGISTGIVTASLLLGVIVTQNMTDIKLQLASAKAGISASLPQDAPAGFHASNLTHSTGSVTIAFASNSDQRHYTINETTSSWDSATLRDNFVASQSSTTYQTIESAGRTIYIYGNGQATWVNAGIWYRINSDGALSTQQLVKVATSM